MKRQYYTFQLKKDMPLRVIIKRLPTETDPDEIKEALLQLDFPVRSVKQLSKTENNQVIKFPIFAIELENTEKAKEIYDLTRLLYTVILVESYRPRSGLKQCFRCQRFNHTFVGCNLAPRCVICSADHRHKDCPDRLEAKDDKSKLKCVNCGESGHPASYRGCKSYREALERFNKPKTKEVPKTTTGRRFDSRKTQPGLSFSSAVVRNPLTVESQPAQRRMEAARAQIGQAQAGNLTNVNQLVSGICPMISGLGSALDRIMLLSKLVEICLGGNV